MNKKFEHLISLLDDEDEQSANYAMAELLTLDRNLDPLLQEIQESNNPSLRRRVHQLQSIISIRRRRQYLSSHLKKNDLDLFKGLCELHFLWYDNDYEDSVSKHWNELMKAAEKYRPDSPEKMAYFMRKTGFMVADREEMDADCFCMGIVLEDRVGADFIVCSVAAKIASIFRLDLQIVKYGGEFALVDSHRQILQPQRDWHITKLNDREKVTVWSKRQLLKLTTVQLFYSAVSTDSFRYIFTIGNCLAEMSRKPDLDFLPYPLSPGNA